MLNYNKKFKNKGKRVPKSFYYSSLNNSDLLKINKLKQNLKTFFKKNREKPCNFKRYRPLVEG